MYVDFMFYLDLFIVIINGVIVEDRMICFVEYYFILFYEGCKGVIVKKLYNFIIGEIFYCFWRMLKSEVVFSVFSSFFIQGVINYVFLLEEFLNQVGVDCYIVRFVVEQVFYYFLVLGFYVECIERKMCVNVYIWIKSKFLGMLIGVIMVGEGIFSLLEYGEEYIFFLFCVYVWLILIVFWVELGGKVSVNCVKIGYLVSIIFYIKLFYGGKLYWVIVEVKYNIINIVVCRV